jgi:hypothetical protein
LTVERADGYLNRAWRCGRNFCGGAAIAGTRGINDGGMRPGHLGGSGVFRFVVFRFPFFVSFLRDGSARERVG